ncbi:MAG: hypothetical protein H5U21_10485 [Porphyrobacter sp.]|nr:hypothetical protein [Porphyrobacter sp.]
MDRLEVTEGHQMVIRKALFALATAGLVVGSTAATANARVASPVAESENMAGGGSFAWIIAALIAAGVIGVIVSDDDENDDLPTSP